MSIQQALEEGDMDNARNKVRTLGRVLEELNDGELGPWKDLSYFFSGPNFRKVPKTVRSLSMKADSPQLALNAGR